MHERQDLGEARGKSETEKARQNLESEVLVRLNGLSEMSGLRPRSRDGRKSRTVTGCVEARGRPRPTCGGEGEDCGLPDAALGASDGDGFEFRMHF